MITYYHSTIREQKAKKISEFKAGTWIHVENPTQEEIKTLVEQFKLEEDLLSDALDPFEVPRAELEEGTTYVFTRVPSLDDGEASTTPLLVAVGSNFVLTLSRKSLPFLNDIIKGKKKVVTTQKTNFFIQIFFQISRVYNSSIMTINRKTRSIQVDVRRVSKSDLAQFVVYESRLNDFLAALMPTDTLLRDLLSGRYLKLFEDDEDLVEDLKLSNGELLGIIRSNLKIIENIRNAYSTLITNDLNHTIRILTALTIILTVPTMIASFYGMNVALPLEQDPNAFFYIAGTAALVALGIYTIFASKKWL